jgi:hypothetical protein
VSVRAIPDTIRLGQLWPNEWIPPLMDHNMTASLGRGERQEVGSGWRE